MVREHTLERPIDPSEVKSASTLTKRITLFIGIALTLLVVWLGTLYATSPAPIRNPELEHYHFRMQLLIDGKAENFGGDKYRASYEKGACSAELTDRPIHFHDNKDQFVHIHWAGMTGGLVLKNYGWNFIGGSDGVLGYRFDNMLGIKSVPIHSDSLPIIPAGSKFYIFAGDETSFVERSFNEFKSQDFETFFGAKSNLNTDEPQSFWDKLFPEAHGEMNQKSLEEINNLLGNVVIFVQKERPSYEQVKQRFNNLEPLSASSCAG